MKRSREEVIERILEICREPSTKTKIVYQVNLNFHTIIPYLSLLVKSGLLEDSGASIIIYKTTPKGIKALEHIKALRALLKPIEGSEGGSC
ncbi:MAG: hypothetical protein A4E48_00051 [Methanosaeta sp. PtaU1.Bin060]|jgi:predicted transcriptional regulator|nr:winged helix-turn-helix domain-containing protein [Methanosarcina sp.]OPY55524.1 MAG: hypothetical protein A4E48_00051 [Methanosaeta sp. PtaU1.Bin060]